MVFGSRALRQNENTIVLFFHSLSSRPVRFVLCRPCSRVAHDARKCDKCDAAFNDLDGVPATASPFVLKKVLRDEWKFDGLVVSDYTAVMELMFHGLARTEADAAMYALNAGTDIEMVSRFYNRCRTVGGPRAVSYRIAGTTTANK